MATFAPSVPEADPARAPDFMNFSRSISPYELRASADRSKGIALSGLGKALDEGVTAYGAVKEQSIKDEAYQKLQPIIDDTTAALEGAVQSKQQGQTQSLLTTAAPEPSGENAPASVQQGIDKIQYLSGVGKLKPDLQTHLSGQIAAVQKEMRAENPGFIPFIDQEVSKVTGGINANSHLQNLMTQVASADQTRQSWQKEVATKLLSATAEGAGVEYGTTAQGVMNGTIPVEQGIRTLSEANKKLYKNKQDESDINLKIKKKEDASGDAEMYISNRANDFFYGMFHSAVTGGGAINNESMEQYLQDVSEGKIKNDPAQLQQLADTLEARKADALIKLRTQLTSHERGQMSMYDALHNPEKFDKLLSDASDEYTKNVQLIRSGNGLGLAHALARNNQSIQERAENNILNDPVIAPFAQNIPALQKIFGNTKQFQDMIDKTMVNPKMATKFQGWFQDAATSMWKSNGQIPISTLITNAQRISQTPTGKAAGQQEMARTYNEVLKLGDYLENGTNQNGKAYLARSMYGQNNQNLIDKFDTDQQVDVFNRFVSKGKVDAITKLNDSKLASDQKDWAETTFFKTYKNELGDLKDILQGKENLLHASWDTETNHWKVSLADTSDQPGFNNPVHKFVKGLFPPVPEAVSSFVQKKASGYDRVQENISRINSALDNMSYLEKQRGGSTNGFMTDVLGALGANPGKADSPDATIEDKFARAIMSGRKPPEMKSNYSPEGGNTNEAQDAITKSLDKGAHGGQLNPEFKSNLTKALQDYQEETGNKPKVSSLFRTRQEQARAYANYQHGGGLAAPPGHSRHEVGEAADLNSDPKFLSWMNKNINRYGLEFLPGNLRRQDPAHIQLKRSQEARQ